MARGKTKVQRLCEAKYIQKKAATDLLEGVVVDICFSLLKPISDHVYRQAGEQKKTDFGIYCCNIFASITGDVKEASKAKDPEVFKELALTTAYDLRDKVHRLCENHPLLDCTSEVESKELEDFEDKYEFIFNRFFKRKPRRRKA